MRDMRRQAFLKEQKESPFKPRLLSKSIERVFLDRNKDFYSRMREYSKNKSSKIKKIEKEIQNRDCTFRPNLIKSAKSIEKLRNLEIKRKKKPNKKNWSRKSFNYSSQFHEHDDEHYIETFGDKSTNKMNRNELLKKYLESEIASRSPNRSSKQHLRKVSQNKISTIKSSKNYYKKANEIFSPMQTKNSQKSFYNSNVSSTKQSHKRKISNINSSSNTNRKDTYNNKKERNPDLKSFYSKKKNLAVSNSISNAEYMSNSMIKKKKGFKKSKNIFESLLDT